MDAADQHRAWLARRRALERGPVSVSPAGASPKWRKRVSDLVVTLGGLALRATPLHAIGRRNALAPRLAEIELALPRLPGAFDGLRLLQVSDTHLDHLPELAPIARRLLDGLEVDLLVLTGDVQGRHDAPIERATGLLAEVLSGVRVRDRRLAILGNHDPAEMADALVGLGFEVLVNRSIVLERGGDRLHVTGLDDVHYFYTEAALRALEARPPERAAFRLALIHSAELADRAAAAGCDLYLCGHTHGGQVCPPGGRPIATHLARCRSAAKGLWRWDAMTGYTSNGLGVSGPRLRFNCPAEAVLFTLRRGG
ncbi:MAG: metallophosphoesterase [Reyranellaceae bacterium]